MSGMNRAQLGQAVPRAILLAVETDDQGWSTGESLTELENLANTAGIEVVERVTQRLRSPQPTFYMGKGKVAELLTRKSELRADTVIADDELTPSQQRNLENALGVQVLDRTAVILHIFSLHARSKEGYLQVELAQYRYRLPRLTGRGVELSRLGAGINTRGPGETKLESDRRRIRKRISDLTKEIERVRSQRSLSRQRRRLSGVPVVALVGYTNAGKSSLMNAMTGADVLSNNQLFVTLDPTTRRCELANHMEVLITDTVGFIQKLPTDLVTAFRATLEEITEADLLVHVVDASHPQAIEQAEAVEDELEALGVSDRPRLTVLNKTDLVSDLDQEALRSEFAGAVALSALTREGMPELHAAMSESITTDFVPICIRVPHAEAEIVALFRARGVIDGEIHEENGTVLTGKIPPILVTAFRSYVK